MEKTTSLGTIAKRAWGQAVSDFYNPPLPEPVVENKESSSSYFYIDSTTWTVHLNTAGVPLHSDPGQAEPYLRSICHHEIQHYLLCPFDGVTNGLMFSAARQHVADDIAMFVCNVFADLVVDTTLLKRFPSLTRDRITTSIVDSALRTTDHSPLWILVISTYRWMWDFSIPEGVDVDDGTREASQRIVDVARKYIDNEHRWPSATGEIAKIVAEWLPEDCEMPRSTGSKTSSPEEKPGEGSLAPEHVPPDLDGIMGSPTEDRNGDRARRCANPEQIVSPESEMERMAIEVEDRGGSLKDLESVYIMAGGGTGSRDWIRFWYRAKVRGLLKFHVAHRRPQGSIPLTPSNWRLGDPVEELDVVQSLQAFPVLVPNMSTRRWITSLSYGEDSKDSLPDMLVVLDSSGSMTWAMGPKDLRGPYHVALVSALAAVDTALRKGSRIAAINFSGNILMSGWGRNRSEVESTLLAYQGGGTVMPVKTIEALCEEATSNVMSIIITDAGVSNWGPFVKTISQLSREGHKMFIFHIGSRKSKSSKVGAKLIRSGATVIPVSSVGDLQGLVVSEVRKVYLHDT